MKRKKEKTFKNKKINELRDYRELKMQIYSEEKRRLVNELHAPARKNFTRRRVITKGIDDLWQIDLVEMRSFAKMNKNFNYILTVIDVFSKYGWAAPLKTKSGREVAATFSEILNRGRIPKNLQSDNGKEFYNTDFNKLMKNHGINHYSTYSVLKASVVERWNRTLKDKMWKVFSLSGSYRWTQILPDLVSEYNQQKHRTIGMAPIKVTHKNSKHLLETVYNNVKIVRKPKFKIGDFVRISKFKTVFAKGYTPNWSTEIFQIAKVQNTNPRTYLLNDEKSALIKGGFYEQELHAVKYPDVYLVEKILRKKGTKVYVKWLGLDKTHNSWINKSNVL